MIFENQALSKGIAVPRLNREESQARTRNLLIEAARREIVRKGFGMASIRDIAEAAGFSLGAIYSNFPDKEAILLELIQRHQSDERARIEAALARANGDAAAAMAGIEKWAETVNSDPDLGVLAIELQLHALRSPAFGEVYNEMNRKHRRALGGMIAQLFELFGKKAPGDPTEIASGLATLSRGLALAPAGADGHRGGRIVLTFLKALLEAAPPAKQAGKPRRAKA
jgi:AcrR family transcriptional regulator